MTTGVIITEPSSPGANNAGFLANTAQQPNFAKYFGTAYGDTAATMGRNLVPNGAGATLIGTPALSTNYATFAGNGGSGLLTPIIPSGVLSVVSVFEVPNLGTNLGAQIVGNYIGGAAADLVDLDITSVQAHALYGSGQQINMTYGGALPTTWKLYYWIMNPTGALTMGSLTDNLSASGTGTTAPATQTPLQIGTYWASQATPGYVGTNNMHFIGIWNGYALTAADLAALAIQLRWDATNNNGWTI